MTPQLEMSLSETAHLLDVPEQAVLRWSKKGALPCRTVRGELIFGRSAVESWAKRMGMRLHGDGAEAKAEPNALAMSIARGDLVDDLPGCDRIEALSNLLSLIELPERVTRDELLDMLLAREKLASTAAGEGVAIPHPRKPLADLIDEPHVWVARPRDPIDWGSIDQKPVRLVLLVLSCSLKGHLDMLSRIALVMRAPEVRKALEQEPDRDKLCEIIEAHPG